MRPATLAAIRVDGESGGAARKILARGNLNGGDPMNLLRHTSTARRRSAQASLACAQCGEELSMPEWSEWLDNARVRHLWTCSACGYAFETTVRYAIEIDTAA